MAGRGQEGAQIGLIGLAHLAARPRVAGVVIQTKGIGGLRGAVRQLQPGAGRIVAGTDLAAHRKGDLGRGHRVGEPGSRRRGTAEQQRGRERDPANRGGSA